MEEDSESDELKEFEELRLRRLKLDTSAKEARNGKDIQGIPWKDMKINSDRFRVKRLAQYTSFRNLDHPLDEMIKECKAVKNGHKFYDFWYNTRRVKPSIAHFQMRDLLASTSKHDVYYVEYFSVKHWSCISQKSQQVLDVYEPIVPIIKQPKSQAQTLSRVNITSMSVKNNLLVAGGARGELICKYLNQKEVAFCTITEEDTDGITTSVDLSHNPSDGSMRVITANNDCLVRVYDPHNFACINTFTFPWSVNSTSMSPDGRLLAIVGDSMECLLAEAQTGKIISNLKGHLDYSFSSAWHPDGRIFATGNQDTTCRLWDVRNFISIRGDT